MPTPTKRYCLPKLRTFIDEKGFGVGSFIDESKQLATNTVFKTSPSSRTWQDAMKPSIGVTKKMTIRIQTLSEAVFKKNQITVLDGTLDIVEVIKKEL